MVLGRKIKIFLGKTKKTTTVFGTLHGQTPRSFFLGFSLGKSWFSVPSPSFPRKKMVLGQHTNYFLGNRWVWDLGRKSHFAWRKAGLEVKTKFFLGKRSFWAGKFNFFLRENKHLFGVWPYSFPKNDVFCFPREKLVFGAKPFFPRGSCCFTPRPNFS